MNKKLKRDIIQYSVLTFLLTWICWGALILFKLPAMSSWYATALYMLGGVSTAIVALLLPLFREKDARKEYYKRFFKFGIPVSHYLLPFAPALAMVGVSYLLVYLFERNAATGIVIQPVYMIFPLFIAMLFGGGVEEFGWRGVMVNNLKKSNPLWIALGVGCIWSLWHIPLFFIQGVLQYQASYPAFFVSVIGYSLVLTMIYLKSESVIPCLIFHALVNALSGMGFIYGNDQNMAVWIDSFVKLGVGFVFYNILLCTKGKIKREEIVAG